MRESVRLVSSDLLHAIGLKLLVAPMREQPKSHCRAGLPTEGDEPWGGRGAV
jgi:hypothetical protein